MRLCCSALVLVGVLASACDEAKEYPEERRRAVSAVVGGVRVAVELSRGGSRYPFGQGGGTGGMLDPAHDQLRMRGWIALRRADGTEIDYDTYERFVAQGLLFEWSWDSRQTEDARRVWDETWRQLAIEHCDIGDGRRFGIRVPTRSGRSDEWRVVVVDGARWVETQRALGASCNDLRGKYLAAREGAR
jgi:hypothetical protein